MFVSLAQWESDRTSERNRDIQAHLRSKGRYAGNKPMLERKRVIGIHTGPDGRKRIKTKSLAWDDEMRAVMGLIVKMRDEEGLGWHRHLVSAQRPVARRVRLAAVPRPAENQQPLQD
jgi:hypothetical protein